MSGKKTNIKCKCGWKYEAYSPDSYHTAWSLDEREAKNNSSDGRVIPETLKEDCENPKCMHPITVYWYSGIAGWAFG